MNQKFAAAADTTASGRDSGFGPSRPVEAKGSVEDKCAFLNGLTFPTHYTYLTHAGHGILSADCGKVASPGTDAEMMFWA